jgi:hypothetical protein
VTDEEQAVLDTANRLAEARVAFSKAFLMSKVSPDGMPVTDKTAEHRATEMTGDAVTRLEAELQVALMIAVRNQPPKWSK